MIQSKRPFIFITNDDGIDAKGIHVLIEEMSKIGDVLAIAPSTGQSGMSHAITFSSPVRFKQHIHEPALQTFSLSGTPVDCVKMALDSFFKDRKPDVLVSGINHGSNASICSVYSGTVAAAREGAINAIPSIAFSSTDFDPDANFDYFRTHIQTITNHVLTHGLPHKVFLNVNFPGHNVEHIKGMRVCQQTQGVWVEEFDRRHDPHNREYFWLTGRFENYEPTNEATDEYALKENYTAIVPLRVETTDNHTLTNLMTLNTY